MLVLMTPKMGQFQMHPSTDIPLPTNDTEVVKTIQKWFCTRSMELIIYGCMNLSTLCRIPPKSGNFSWAFSQRCLLRMCWMILFRKYQFTQTPLPEFSRLNYP